MVLRGQKLWDEIFDDYCVIEWQRDNTGDVDVNRRTDQKIADFDAAVLKEQMSLKPAILSGNSAVKSGGFNGIEIWLVCVRKVYASDIPFIA